MASDGDAPVSVLAKAIEVPKIRFHDLRHTHATLLLEAGVPEVAVAERLGHSSTGTLNATYAHVTPKMRSDAAQLAAAMIGDSRGY